jgi:hypothetical protein
MVAASAQATSFIKSEGMFAAGTLSFLLLRNISLPADPRSVRITEIRVAVSAHEELPAHGLSVLQSTTIQAGGRGQRDGSAFVGPGRSH